MLGAVALCLLAAGGALAQQRPVADAGYRIRQGDKLSVKFLYQPEFNELTLTVRPDGLISLQMIDDIQAAGLTAAELKARIERAYSETLLNPVVSVGLLEFVAPSVFVGGQVDKPGSYELRNGDTVLQAVILAGGFTREAHRRMVLHARPAGAGQLKVTPIDLQQLVSPGGKGRELTLEDGDYVFVPDSKLSKLTRIVEAFRFAVPGFALTR